MGATAAETPIGRELPSITRVIPQEKITLFRNHLGLRVRELAAPVRDFHTDIDEARRLGFPRTVAQSLHYYAFISEIATNFFGEPWLTTAKMSTVFLKPVFEGDVITAKAVVKDKLAEGSRTRVVLEVWCDNQNGERVLAGTASALMS